MKLVPSDTELKPFWILLFAAVCVLPCLIGWYLEMGPPGIGPPGIGPPGIGPPGIGSPGFGPILADNFGFAQSLIVLRFTLVACLLTLLVQPPLWRQRPLIPWLTLALVGYLLLEAAQWLDLSGELPVLSVATPNIVFGLILVAVVLGLGLLKAVQSNAPPTLNTVLATCVLIGIGLLGLEVSYLASRHHLAAFPTEVISQPYALLPVVTLVITILLLRECSLQRHGLVGKNLLLAVVASLAMGQVYVAFGSLEFNDYFYQVGELFKLLAVAVLFVGFASNQTRFMALAHGQVNNQLANSKNKSVADSESPAMSGAVNSATESVEVLPALERDKTAGFGFEVDQNWIRRAAFFSNVANEFKAPINGVLGTLNLLGKSELNKDQSRMVALALNGARQLQTLVNNLFDYSSAEAGSLDVEVLNFNLLGLVREVVENSRQEAEDKKLALQLDMSGVSEAVLLSDPARIRQVLGNLVSNAIKFTKKGSVQVTVSTHSQPSGAVRLDISVEDSGVGIEPELHGQLFETASRAEAVPAGKQGGAGMGLALVRRLCLLLGGDIEVESQAGAGSCFRAHFMVAAGEPITASIPNVDLAGQRVMIVDPEYSGRKHLAEQLVQWGLTVSFAEDGKSALIELEECGMAAQPLPDFLLVERHMPGMNGAVLGRIIRSDPRYAGIRLVSLSRIGSPGEARSCAELGFDAYLPQPLMPVDLHSTLSVLLLGGTFRERAKPLVTRHYVREMGREFDQFDPTLAPYRVLVVEDNKVNQVVAIGLLEELGLSHDIAQHGRQALAMLVAPTLGSAYHLVLMACHMPGMDGYETAREIRRGSAGEANRNLPIVGMSAIAGPADRQLCVDCGMSDLVPKPLDGEHLRDVLVRWLMNVDAPERVMVANEISEPDHIWDEAGALRRVRGKPERLYRLLELFMDDAPSQLAALRVAIDGNEFGEAIELAHMIKGVAGNLSSPALMASAERTRQACDLRQVDEAISEYELMTRDYAALLERMVQFRASHAESLQNLPESSMSRNAPQGAAPTTLQGTSQA